MSTTRKEFPKYLRNLIYNRKTKKIVSSFVPKDVAAETVIEEMKKIKPSQLTQDDVRGFIRFSDDRYSKEEYSDAQQGKWILRFPSGSENIDKAWEKLVDCVAKGELEEIKVYPQSKTGPFAGEQSICIYNLNINDNKKIVANYDKLKELGLVDLHLQESMNNGLMVYKSDQQTSNNEYGEKAYLYSNKDIDSLKKETASNLSSANNNNDSSQRKEPVSSSSNVINQSPRKVYQTVEENIKKYLSTVKYLLYKWKDKPEQASIPVKVWLAIETCIENNKKESDFCKKINALYATLWAQEELLGEARNYQFIGAGNPLRAIRYGLLNLEKPRTPTEPPYEDSVIEAVQMGKHQGNWKIFQKFADAELQKVIDNSAIRKNSAQNLLNKINGRTLNATNNWGNEEFVAADFYKVLHAELLKEQNALLSNTGKFGLYDQALTKLCNKLFELQAPVLNRGSKNMALTSSSQNVKDSIAQKYIIYKSPGSGNLRKITVIDGQPYYESTGNNSGAEGVWFPFIMLRGTKPINCDKLSSRYNKELFKARVSASSEWANHMLKFDNDVLLSSELNYFDGRIPTKTSLITSYRLGSTDIDERFLLESELTHDEMNLAKTPINMADQALFESTDTDAINQWLISQGAKTVKDSLRPSTLSQFFDYIGTFFKSNAYKPIKDDQNSINNMDASRAKLTRQL